MASAYFVVSNATANLISLDGGDFRQSIPASGTLNIYSNDLVGNKALCDQLSTLVTAGSISVTRNSNSVTAADLTSFGFGADMLSSQYDQDQNEVADDSENLSIQSPTSIDDSDSPYDLLSSDTVVIVDASGGTVQVNLPAVASSSGRVVTVKDNGSAGTNNVTIEASGAETIDGGLRIVLSSNYASASLYCDGTEWFTREFSQADIAESITDGSSIVTGSDMIKSQTGYVGSITEVDDSLSPYTVLVSDEVIMCDSALGTISLVLPDPATVTNKTIVVKDQTGSLSTNAVTLTAAAGTIDGGASMILSDNYSSVRLLSDGVRWMSIDKVRPQTGSVTYLQSGAGADVTVSAWIASGPGVITGAFAFPGTAAPVDSGQTMGVDVQIGGVSALSSVITLDETTTTDVVEGTLDAAAVTFAKGDVISIVYDVTAGDGAPADALADTVVSFQYDLY